MPTDPPTPPSSPDGAAAVRILARTNGESRRLVGADRLPEILADPEALVWVDVTSSTPSDVLPIADLLDLHPLITDDIAERNQRAKVAEVEGMIHVVLFWIAYQGEVTEVEVDLVLGPRALLTVHEPGWDPYSLPQLRGDPGNNLKRGPDYLLYSIADGIVDGYFPVIDALDDEIDALQDDVIQNPTTWTLERLFAIKRELIRLRRAMSPSREIFNQLTNRDLALVRPEHIVYFRDVYDHLIRVTDELDNDRELVSGTLEVYLSTVNNNLATIMKRLTGVTVVFAGVGAFAGIFGMSEAAAAISNGEPSGFWLVTGVIVLGAMLTAFVLRRINWI